MIIRENRCQECPFFKDRKCSIRYGGHIRKCAVGLNIQYQELISKNEDSRVLEVGCGTWSPLKEALGGQWYGIDPIKINKRGEQTVATKIGSVSDIPYPDEFFDYVITNQSIEHWYEYGVSFKKGLSEISRVLKNGGKCYINAPIHFHGHKYFFRGNLKKIAGLFEQKYWDVIFTKWRENCQPLEPYRPFEESSIPKYIWRGFKCSWILDIRLDKKVTMPKCNWKLILPNWTLTMSLRKSMNLGLVTTLALAGRKIKEFNRTDQ